MNFKCFFSTVTSTVNNTLEHDLISCVTTLPFQNKKTTIRSSVKIFNIKNKSIYELSLHIIPDHHIKLNNSEGKDILRQLIETEKLIEKIMNVSKIEIVLTSTAVNPDQSSTIGNKTIDNSVDRLIEIELDVQK